MLRRLTTLFGAFLVQEFGDEHHDDQAGPVGDGVAEKGANMRIRVPAAVEDDPDAKDRT